jgi:hypothetical protein
MRAGSRLKPCGFGLAEATSAVEGTGASFA